MKFNFFYKQVLPFVFLYTMMIGATILIDFILHRYEIVYIGRYFGLSGTLILVLSFVYSFRKRKYFNTGSPKKWLNIHEYLAWLGSIMLLVHSGIHFNAIIPWLAVYMLLISVASGLVGKFLLKNANLNFDKRKMAILDSGANEEEAENELFFDAIMVEAIRKWRVVHLPIAFIFAFFSLIHIIAVLIFSNE